MGFEPPKKGHYHEVSVGLKGPVTKKEFEAYKKRMRRYLRELKKMGLDVRYGRPKLWRHPPTKPPKKRRKRKKAKK